LYPTVLKILPTYPSPSINTPFYTQNAIPKNASSEFESFRRDKGDNAR